MSLDFDHAAGLSEAAGFEGTKENFGFRHKPGTSAQILLFEAPKPKLSAAQTYAIRAFDACSATLLLIAVLPFLIILAVALQIDSPGRLFFVQKRVGANGKMFSCLKFRTMCENADAVLERHLATCSAAREEWSRNFKLRHDPRVTRLGKFVRRLSLDEFPQLLNIISGDMSVVGPRPIVRAEICRYGRYFASYCSVKPGLTGLWQVSGRSDISYHERVMMDVHYVQTKSLLTDIGIVLRTVPAVLTARGSC